MDDQVTAQNKKFKCIECENEVQLPDEAQVADVIECDFCGIEYEIMELNEDGSAKLQIVEEEK